jgi:holo-[acyl-carrier protein] synthase
LIIGLGIDLVEISRARRSLDRWGERLYGKLMGPDEVAGLTRLADDPALALAMTIALKEAGSKAIGTGWSRGVFWRDVVVEAETPPGVRLENRAAEVAQRLGSSGRTRAVVEVRGDLVLAEVRLLN